MTLQAREHTIVWNLHPLLLWSSQAKVAGVRSVTESTVLWREPAEIVEPGLFQVSYTGEALQPGEAYNWLFYFQSGSEEPMFWRTFQVLGGEERDRISAELDTLTAILKIQDADAEAIALERTRYFLAEDLLADALQEIFSVENPSAVLIETREALVAEICQSQTAAAAQAPGDASEN
ncbi:hypothetical protein [Sphaerothrix gracilis]|uniref:hypothetical protein n=1 Tax=Sphaerothrix gracilis TaxID=3151835 RepID=UPI0031FE29BB